MYNNKIKFTKVINTVHLTAEDVFLFNRNALANSTKLLIQKHLEICTSCNKRVLLFKSAAVEPGIVSPGEKIQAFFTRFLFTLKEVLPVKAAGLLKAKHDITGRGHIRVLCFSVCFLILLAGIAIPIITFTTTPQGGITRIKGMEPYINIYRKTDDNVETLLEGSFVNQLDHIQISYVSFNMDYGMIFSFDGKGTITVHYPDPLKGNNFSIVDKEETFLPHSFILDDAPYFERFFFITSTKLFTEDEIIKATGELISSPDRGMSGGLNVSKGIKQHSIILYKKGDQEDDF